MKLGLGLTNVDTLFLQAELNNSQSDISCGVDFDSRSHKVNHSNRRNDRFLIL